MSQWVDIEDVSQWVDIEDVSQWVDHEDVSQWVDHEDVSPLVPLPPHHSDHLLLSLLSLRLQLSAREELHPQPRLQLALPDTHP